MGSPKMVRDSDDYTLMSSLRRTRCAKPWYERLFDHFRAWIIESDRRAYRQNCCRRNQMWFFGLFFLILWAVVYVYAYGMPLQNWTVDDLAMFIPKKHRGNVNPKKAEVATPEPAPTKPPSSLTSRLNANSGRSSGNGRRPTDPLRRLRP